MVRSLSGVLLVCFVITCALVGCRHFDDGAIAPFISGEAPARQVGRTNLRVAIRLDERDPSLPPLSIRAENGQAVPQVQATLLSIDRNNPTNPRQVATTVADVVDGVAEVVFHNVPTLPTVASLTILGGSIGDFREFRGALDVEADAANQMIVQPAGSRMRYDLVGHVAEAYAYDSAMLAISPENLIRTIISILAPLPPTRPNLLADAVDALRRFSSPTVPDEKGVVVRSVVNRDMNPLVSPEDRTAIAQAQRIFSIGIYNALRQSNTGNFCASPLSVWMALAMVYAGAAGETASEMATALGITLPPERLHPAVAWLEAALRSRRRTNAIQVQIVNTLWTQMNLPIQPGFLDVLARSYDAGVFQLDFARNPEAARTAMNRLIAFQTENAVTQIMPSGGVDAGTRLVLTSSSLFKGHWRFPFVATATELAPFYRSSTEIATVSMMWHPGIPCGFIDREELQATMVPFEGGKLGMLLIVPKGDRFPEIEAQVSPTFLGAIRGSLEHPDHLHLVDLKMPAFGCKIAVDLDGALNQLGMRQIYSQSGANLSGLSNSPGVHLGRTTHETTITVDEQGTGAGAAAAATIYPADGLFGHGGPTEPPPPPPASMIIDRPFIYVLYDLETVTILYLGRCLSPTDATNTPNFPPLVAITTPPGDHRFEPWPAQIEVVASASDRDGQVVKVEFFRGSTKIGEDDTEPYSCTIVSPVAGLYQVWAKATDNLGAYRLSKPSSFLIREYEEIPLGASRKYRLMRLPPGTFTMGVRDMGEVRPVTLTREIWMGEYEVTQELWQTVMIGSPNPSQNTLAEIPLTLPVDSVSWYQAIDFCNRMSEWRGLDPCYTLDGNGVTCNFAANGYRLPTEAEWEYACRAGSDLDFWWGGTASPTAMWYATNSQQISHPVGLKYPNQWNLFDFHGNLWEWCWDYVGDYPPGPATDPTGPETGTRRIARGGGYLSSAFSCRAGHRATNYSPNDTWPYLGFRVCRRQP